MRVGVEWGGHFIIIRKGVPPRGRCGHPSEAFVTLSRHWKIPGSQKGQIIHEAYISTETSHYLLEKYLLLGGERKRAFLLLLLPVSKQLGKELHSIPFPRSPGTMCVTHEAEICPQVTSPRHHPLCGLCHGDFWPVLCPASKAYGGFFFPFRHIGLFL